MPELCIKLVSVTEHQSAQGWAPRPVAIRGLAILAWRHRSTLRSDLRLQAHPLHDRILNCLQRASNTATTGMFQHTDAVLPRHARMHCYRRSVSWMATPSVACRERGIHHSLGAQPLAAEAADGPRPPSRRQTPARIGVSYPNSTRACTFKLWPFPMLRSAARTPRS